MHKWAEELSSPNHDPEHPSRAANTSAMHFASGEEPLSGVETSNQDANTNPPIAYRDDPSEPPRPISEYSAGNASASTGKIPSWANGHSFQSAPDNGTNQGNRRAVRLVEMGIDDSQMESGGSRSLFAARCPGGTRASRRGK